MKDKDDRLFQFPFYPESFLVSTMLMSPAEVGAYMRLLCHSWLDDGIPFKSKSHLARLAGISTSKLEQILSKFYVDDENRVRHHRLEEVRKSVADLREKRRKAGALGGKASKQSYSNAVANRQQKSSNAQPSKIKQNKTKYTPLNPPSKLSTADKIALERERDAIAEEIKDVYRKASRDAMGSVVSWDKPDDRERVQHLREQEQVIKDRLRENVLSIATDEPANGHIPDAISILAAEKTL